MVHSRKWKTPFPFLVCCQWNKRLLGHHHHQLPYSLKFEQHIAVERSISRLCFMKPSIEPLPKAWKLPSIGSLLLFTIQVLHTLDLWLRSAHLMFLNVQRQLKRETDSISYYLKEFFSCFKCLAVLKLNLLVEARVSKHLWNQILNFACYA